MPIETQVHDPKLGRASTYITKLASTCT